MYLNRRRKKFQNQFLDELPNAVEAIVRGVKSGLPLNDSMRLVAKEAKEPIKSEFQKVIDQQSVGKSIQEAVLVLYRARAAARSELLRRRHHRAGAGGRQPV